MASTGVERLSLVLGLVCGSLAAYVSLGIWLDEGREVGVKVVYVAFTSLAFVVPWGAVRVVAWIVAGFREKE